MDLLFSSIESFESMSVYCHTVLYLILLHDLKMIAIVKNLSNKILLCVLLHHIVVDLSILYMCFHHGTFTLISLILFVNDHK